MSTLPMSAGKTTPDDVAHLHRVRNGVRVVLALGVAASVAGNVLHAESSLVGRAIAAWSPLALLLAVELISRVPVHKLGLSVLRMGSTAAIAGIAAWVSYGHMVSVALKHGEGETSAHLLPLSVDGLVVVASVSLVEIAARLHHANTLTTTAEEAPPVDEAPKGAPEASAEAVDGSAPAAGYRVHPDARVEPVEPAEPVEPTENADTTPEPTPAPRTTARREGGRSAGASTTAKVARLRRAHPDWTLARIAKKAELSERTVRRHLKASTTAAPAATTAADTAADVAA